MSHFDFERKRIVQGTIPFVRLFVVLFGVSSIYPPAC